MLLAQRIKNLVQPGKSKIDEPGALYVSTSLYNLAGSLIGIYLPIYIFNLSYGNSFFHRNYILNGISWVCLFYILISFSTVVTTILFEKSLFSKLKLKKSLFLGTLLLILHLLLIFSAEKFFYLVILSAVVRGIQISFYWIPYHIFFSKRADNGDNKYGKEVGKREFYGGLVTSLGPLFGGLIITQLGFSFLYGLAIIILLASSLPILLYVTENIHREHKIKDVLNNYLFNKKYGLTSLSFAGKVTAATIAEIFWSLMLYFGLRNFVEIGTLNTFSGILATSLFLVVGKSLDRTESSKIHGFGVFINTGLNLMRPFISNPPLLYANNITDKLNSPAYETPFSAKTYEEAIKSGSISDFIVYREIILHSSRVVVLSILTAGVLFTEEWKWVFFAAALGSGLSILIGKRTNKAFP